MVETNNNSNIFFISVDKKAIFYLLPLEKFLYLSSLARRS